MLKREIAPITREAWEAIDKRAKEVFTTYLSARKVVNVNGPKGLDYTVVPEGRLENVKRVNDSVSYGTYKVKPLIEARIEFELDRWELDNLTRGAKYINFDNLEEAVKKIALFEENAIYNGLETAQLEGLLEISSNEIPFGNDNISIMNALTEGMIKLKEVFEEGPYVLVVGKEVLKRLNKENQGYPLIKRVKELLGTDIVYSHVVDGALLVPYDHEDLEMTIGQDFAIGYQESDIEKVRFFITESFTFRILNPDIIIKYTV